MTIFFRLRFPLTTSYKKNSLRLGFSKLILRL